MSSAQVGLIDFGMGNLFSVEQACKFVGLAPRIVFEPSPLQAFDALILPGVGAFEKAMGDLRKQQMVNPILEFIHSGKPFFGICLGMQLLMTQSSEFGLHNGLNVVEGQVQKFDFPKDSSPMPVPHIGWSRVQTSGLASSPYFRDVSDSSYFYFVHSYYVLPKDPGNTVATCRYGEIKFCAAFQRKNIFATQFHPEKSGEIGLKIFSNFAKGI